MRNMAIARQAKPLMNPSSTRVKSLRGTCTFRGSLRDLSRNDGSGDPPWAADVAQGPDMR